MAILAKFGLKQPNGTWKNYTISINDTIDQFGNNVSIFESQTKEQQEAKEKKVYFANGTKVWDNGTIPPNAPKKEKKATPVADMAEQFNESQQGDGLDLPF